MIESDYHARLEWLCELIRLSPKRSLRALQKEALHMYPVSCKETQRFYLSEKFGQKALKIVEKSIVNQENIL